MTDDNRGVNGAPEGPWTSRGAAAARRALDEFAAEVPTVVFERPEAGSADRSRPRARQHGPPQGAGAGPQTPGSPPPGRSHDSLAGVIEENVHRYFRAADEHRLPTRAELAEVREDAARHARADVPLADLLSAYHLSARSGWEEVLSAADQSELRRWSEHLLAYLRSVTAAVSSGYVEGHQEFHDEENTARRALTKALLAGEPASAHAERAGISLTTNHVVLVFTIGGAADVAAEKVGHLIQEELDAYAGTPVPSVLDGRRGVALLPGPGDTLPSLELGLTSLAERLGAALTAPVRVGAERAVGLSAIPDAVDQAEEIAHLAYALGRPPGAYVLSDVLLEYQLTRPGPGRDRLARILDCLDRHPHLVETLLAYQRSGHNRRQAAAELHVHPNTLDYRLNRVAKLTRLDPGRPADAQLLAAAVIARTPLSGTERSASARCVHDHGHAHQADRGTEQVPPVRAEPVDDDSPGQ
ncbi:PucR C-terminal helix-turn-helix domain-containing protein [Actinopolymorpha singaporensis]|uniref:PucR C-terminal helix-turn-helix domain-containing protein n=1 Tax=Actinopolymorpha singaporensis TaxID=117157 RepID=A0A1H1YZS7_9ACTN|nr:PucR C-terminal helix-turn-helix domain-containing protein [Actinopolymorpha singaporensis]